MALTSKVATISYGTIRYTAIGAADYASYKMASEPLMEGATNPLNYYEPELDEDYFIDIQELIEAFNETDLESPSLYSKIMSPVITEDNKELFKELEKIP